MFLDTPGFDDDTMQDVDILREFAAWLHNAYKNNIKIVGVLLMYEATRTNLSGAGTKTIERIRALAGERGSEKVYLISTKWQDITAARGTRAEALILALASHVPAWGQMVAAGAEHIKLLGDSPEHAKAVLSQIIERNITTPLLIQQELAAGKEFRDTALGQKLGLTIEELESRHEEELRRERAKHNAAMAQNKTEQAARLEKQIKEHEDILKAVKAAAKANDEDNEKAYARQAEQHARELLKSQEDARKVWEESQRKDEEIKSVKREQRNTQGPEHDYLAQRLARLEAQQDSFNRQGGRAESRSDTLGSLINVFGNLTGQAMFGSAGGGNAFGGGFGGGYGGAFGPAAFGAAALGGPFGFGPLWWL